MKQTFLFLWICCIFLSCTKKDVFNFNRQFQGQLSDLKTIGGTNNESLLSIKNTADGGYIAVGHTQSSDQDIMDKNNESYDYWVIKFDAQHQIQWNKTYGGTEDDRARDVLSLQDGSFIVTGFSRSSDGDVSQNEGNYDFWIIKLDAQGNLIWEKSFGFLGADQSYALYQTSDGNLLVGGSLDVTASGGQGNSKSTRKHAGGDFWLIKMDFNGNSIWTRYFGGLFTDTLFGIEETANSNYILVGSSDSEDNDISNNIGGYDYWVVKLDVDGNLLWEKNYGGSQIDEAFSIAKTRDGNFIIAGNARSLDNDIQQNNGSSDVWLIKIDPEGNLIWEKNYGGSSFEDAKKIIPAVSGGFYIAGSSRSSDMDLDRNKGNKDAWMLKIDDMGTLLWQKSLGGTNLEELNSILETTNQTIIAVGESWSSDLDISENKGFSDGLILILQ